MSSMKKNHIVIFITVCLLLACGKNKTSVSKVSDTKKSLIDNELNEQDNVDIPKFLFDNLTYHFGEVPQGEELRYVFYFKNVGNSSLIISDISASCGCTRPIPSKEPIAPGAKGEIAITVETEEKSVGEMISYVVITANTFPEKTILTLHANILSPQRGH